ncbi:MAG: HDIG domain-containing protein, partial [Nitrospirae bacterium]|nr:HDIG domain-containing protein [Nitrospirota bacterium]
ILASFSVIRCKKRHDIIKAGLNVSLANMVTVVIIDLLSDRFYPVELLPSVIFAVASGLSVSAIVSLLLPVLEHVFKVTTDITLLEFVDLDHPLMKKLMIHAPGTYHHSIIVGNLVDAASEEVGVNPLLARVSAYYHDIGKIKMPEYFVENQSSLVNKHDKLMPHLSCMVIISHVKDGLELADEYNLPIPIKSAITEHHGTNLISYFYSKAKEGQTDAPCEEDYRYPGPRPQTRITGLLMIADAVEAASRVLTDPTPSRVNGLIDKIVNQIFLDGQLDECELTLKDIHKIRKRFSYILTSILHKRIEYPGFDFNEKRKKEDTSAPKSSDTDKKSSAKDKAKRESNKPMDESGSNAFKS